MLSSFLFAVVVDVVIELAREGVLKKLLYADNLLLTSETIERLRTKPRKWKETFENKGLKVSFGKSKEIDSSGITNDGFLTANFIHMGSAA